MPQSQNFAPSYWASKIVIACFVSTLLTVHCYSKSFSGRDSLQKENERIQRLQTLADLWGKLYLFHPNIIRADKPIDWHAAVEKAIPAVESARIPDEFVSALNTHFFKILNAPDAFAFKLPDSITSEEWWKKYNFSLLDSGEFVRRRILPRVNLTSTMVYIDAAHATLRGNPMDTLAARYLYDALQTKKNNDTLIIDLRIQDERYDIYAQLFTLRCFTPVFTIGSSISRAHRGWNENMKSMTWQGQKWIVNPMHTKTRTLWGSKVVSEFERRKFQARSSTVIFLVNKATLAFLRDYCAIAKGNANVTMILDTTDNAAVRSVFAAAAAELYPTDSIGVVAFTDILQAQGVMFGVDGMSDSTITDVRNTKRFADVVRAILLQKEKKPTGAFSLDTRFVSPDTIPAQGTPQQMSRESRLRGLFKVWTVVKYLYPHLKTAPVNWDTVLTHYIPKVESARTSQEYYLVMQEFGALLKDSHTFGILPINARGFAVSRPLPPSAENKPLYFPSFTLQKVEGKVIVEARSPLLHDSISLRIGDEIIRINNQSIQEFEAEWMLRISASTSQSLYQALYNKFRLSTIFRLKGADSIVTFIVKRDKKLDTVITPMLTSTQQQSLYSQEFTEPPDSALIKMLPSKICYLRAFDIGRNKEKLLDSALTAWEQTTSGMILDLRGYPKLNYRTLLSKFLTHPAKGAIYSIPFISPRQAFSNALFSESEDVLTLTNQATVQPHSIVRYTKPIITLISERLISQAEDFCIFLKNARRCTFVGTSTTGANGTIAYILLPGGGQVSFTGEEVRYPDGTPFQRIGILPDVKVSPTVNGIRAGRDEVLEKGVEVLQALLKQSSTPAQSSPRK